ncbi:MAG: RNA methyltransferase [Bacillota bacterium]|nr:RNA methyltransferase [Bacillota bacterium]
MDVITSKDNALIKEIKKLNEKKFRVQSNRFLVEGFRFVSEALDSNFEVPTVIISDKCKDRWENFNISSKLKSNTKVIWASDSIVRSICSTENPQGIAAVVENKIVDVNHSEGFYVLADKLQDPGNMGTIIRTANAAGALGVIITKGTVDIYNEKTLRSTMGSIFKIPIIEDLDLSVLKSLKTSGFKLIVSSLETNDNFYDLDMRGKVIIAVGNEGKGISDEIYVLADGKVKIPMPGDVESLNVAVAASVMMFEIVRQKNI